MTEFPILLPDWIFCSKKMGATEEMQLFEPDGAIGFDDENDDDGFVNQIVSLLLEKYHVDESMVEPNLRERGEHSPHQYLQFVKSFPQRAALCCYHYLAQKVVFHYFEEYSIELKRQCLPYLLMFLPLVEKNNFEICY